MALDPTLIGLLVDPVDHQSLLYVASDDVLFNPRTNQVYAVRDDIAVMLPAETRPASEAERTQWTAPGAAIETGPAR